MFLHLGKRGDKKKPDKKGSKKRGPKASPEDKTSVAYIFKKLDELRERTKKEEEMRLVVLGVGNDLKGDDGIGWYVVDILKKSIGRKGDVHFIKTAVPENHISEIREFAPHLIIMVDAADFGGRPGDIRLIGENEIAGNVGGTHTAPLTLFMNLIEDSLSLVPQIIVIGIQRKNTEFGMPISTDVKKAGNKIAKVIEKLYRGRLLQGELEEEIELLVTKNPLKKISDIIDKVTEAGKGKTE